MKNLIVFLFILLTCFISGCEDSAYNKKTTINSQQAKTSQKQATEEIKKQTTLHKKTIKVVKKKPHQPEIDKTDLTENTPAQKALDLSIPPNFYKTTIIDNTSKKKPQDYLPDFFADHNNQKNDALQFNGKIIAREEKEIDKQKSVDGVGIGIKLIP